MVERTRETEVREETSNIIPFAKYKKPQRKVPDGIDELWLYMERGELD